MNAERIILTHFSQRYPKIPVIDSDYEDRICIAFDMMVITLSDLKALPSLLPSLQLLFKELEKENQDCEQIL